MSGIDVSFPQDVECRIIKAINLHEIDQDVLNWQSIFQFSGATKVTAHATEMLGSAQKALRFDFPKISINPIDVRNVIFEIIGLEQQLSNDSKSKMLNATDDNIKVRLEVITLRLYLGVCNEIIAARINDLLTLINIEDSRLNVAKIFWLNRAIPYYLDALDNLKKLAERSDLFEFGKIWEILFRHVLNQYASLKTTLGDEEALKDFEPTQLEFLEQQLALLGLADLTKSDRVTRDGKSSPQPSRLLRFAHPVLPPNPAGVTNTVAKPGQESEGLRRRVGNNKPFFPAAG